MPCNIPEPSRNKKHFFPCKLFSQWRAMGSFIYLLNSPNSLLSFVNHSPFLALMEIAYSWSWFQASNWNSCWCQIHASLCKKKKKIYPAFFLFQVNNQWGFCHLWVSVNLEHTSWNLLNDLSICICTEHSSFGKCSEISQRKGRLKYYITYFGWYSRFLIQKYLLFISKSMDMEMIHLWWLDEEPWLFWITSGESFILLLSPTQITFHHHHHHCHHHCQIIN